MSTAVVTVALAAFPAVYTIEPRLGTEPGLWRDAKWAILTGWMLMLLWGVARLTAARDREADRQRISIAAIDERLSETSETQVELKALMNGLVEAMQSTATGMSSIGEIVRIRSAQEQIAHAVEVAVRSQGLLDELPSLPEDAMLLVVTATPGNSLYVLFPAEMSGSVTEPAVRALVNIFDLYNLSQSAAALLVVGQQHRERLPIGLRATRAAIVAPLLNKDAERVGALVVCSAQEDRMTQPELRVGLHQRVVNIAEQVAPIASRWVLQRAETSVVS